MADYGISYNLNSTEINMVVDDEKIGNYILGYEKENVFYVQYVGRSDTDLKQRLLSHLLDNPCYKSFKFAYAKDIKAAFEKECKSYHKFGGPEGSLDNEIHPDKPDGTDYECPFCKDSVDK